MRKNHRKSFLTLCAGLVLCLCMSACTTGDINVNIEGDINVGTTDTTESETDNPESENTGSENNDDEDPSTQNPNNPNDSGDTPLDPENPNEGGDDGDDNPDTDDPGEGGGDTGDIDPDDPSQGDDPDLDPENPDEGGDDGDDEPNPDDPGSGTNPDPNPDDPESGDEHGDDGDSGSEGGDEGPGDTGDEPSPDDPGSGTNPDPDPENPDEGGDDDDDNPDPGNPDEGDDDDKKGDESSEPIKHEYTYSASTTELNANGGSFTYDGLTWTFSEATALSKDNSGRGVQIGSSSKVQSTPWTFSTDFGETVLLESVSARIYTSTSSGLTAHYELTLDSTSLGSSDFHSSKSTDVYVAEGAGLPLYGQVLTLSINAVNSTAFYFESISLVYYTNVDSGSTGGTGDTGDTGGNTGDTGDTGGSTGGNTGDTGDPGDTGGDTGGSTGGSGSTTPDESDDYTYYQDYAYKFAKGDLSSSGGSLTKNGLTWTYDAPTYIGWDGQFKRGIQIGSNGNPQYEPWTFTTSFDETIKLMDVTVYLYTSTSGNANVSISLGEQEIGSEDFNTTGTSSTSVYLAEYTELERLGDSLTISLKANNAQGFYLKAISLHIYTTEETALNLSADSLEDEPYEPSPVVPGENDVLKTNSSYNLTEEDYYTYNSIDLTLTGEELRTSLRDSYSPVTRYSYGDIRYMLPYVDEDPNNEGYMYGAYDGDELPAYWDSAYYDREHVWPCAHMKLVLDDDGDYRPDNDSVGHYSDLHNLRICCKPVNNYKSDKYFYTTNDSYNFFPNESNPSSLGSGSHSFSPAENYNGETGDHRGDVARICLYMYTMYEGLSLEDGVTGSDNPYTFGQLKTLLLWNYEDEPDEFEIQRNNRIYEYQGNRNPFVDYPELADYLFPNETHYFLSY